MQDPTYIPVSKAAVASAVCAALSVGGFVFPLLAIAVIPAVVCGIIAFVEICKYGHFGRRLVAVGLPLSLTMAVGTVVLEAVLYQSEAPAGYRRITFSRDLDEHVGERICLKGYGPWDGSGESLFGLSSDGSYRDINDVVIVELADGATWDPELDGVAVSGRLERLLASEETDGLPRYVLRDAVLRPSRTGYQLALRRGGDGC